MVLGYRTGKPCTRPGEQISPLLRVYWFIGFKLHFYRENIDPSVKYKLICNNFRIWQRKYIGIVCWVYLLGMMVTAAFCRYRKKVAKQVI